MVKLTKIYTRTGDRGSTGLGDGSRVPKDNIRIETLGAVDEANAAIGLACSAISRDDKHAELLTVLTQIQNDLFDLGGDLCVPVNAAENQGANLRITQAQVDRLESEIDHFNSRLAPLNSFVLPGGHEAASRLHIARTVVRRAERDAVSLLVAETGLTNPLTAVYLNRLSDLLFVLARIANNDGRDDVLWTPGKHRK